MKDQSIWKMFQYNVSGDLTSFDITVAKHLLYGDDSLELAANILILNTSIKFAYQIKFLLSNYVQLVGISFAVN